MQEYHNIS